MEGRSVFISYRRQVSEHLAQRVRNYLIERDFDVFVDLENLDSGEFDRRILREIETRMHFIVVLEPSSLDRIGVQGDWLCREIAHALAHGRNVVPVTASGFEFRRDLALPPDVARLPSFSALPIPQGYFDAAMERLRTRFLKTPPKPSLLPPPRTSSVVAPDRQAAAGPGSLTSGRAPVLPAPRLTRDEKSFPSLVLIWSKVSGAQEYVLERAGGMPEAHDPARGMPPPEDQAGRRPKATDPAPLGYLGKMPSIGYQGAMPRFRDPETGELVVYGPERPGGMAAFGDPESFVEVYRGPDQRYIAGSRVAKDEPVWLYRYRYRVRASASGQAGEWSNTVNVELGRGYP